LLGAIDRFVETEHGDVSSYATGETWSIPVAPGASVVEMVGPDGGRRRLPVTDGRVIYRGTRVGFHRMVTDGVTDTLAATLGTPGESAIEPADDLRVGTTTAETPRSSVPGFPIDPWAILVVLAIAVLAIEWATYHRRLTT
jgi:hypothetical protein